MTMLSSTATKHPQEYSSRGHRSDLITLWLLLTVIGTSLVWGALLLLPATAVLLILMLIFMAGATLVNLGNSSHLLHEHEADVNAEVFHSMQPGVLGEVGVHHSRRRPFLGALSDVTAATAALVMVGPPGKAWRDGYRDGIVGDPNASPADVDYADAYAAGEADRLRFVPVVSS